MLPKVKKRGRPPTDRRLILNGLLYFVRSGCAWRLLPREFGPWETVYGCFRTWRRQGLWKFIHEVLRRMVRRQAGKRSQPTAAILDMLYLTMIGVMLRRIRRAQKRAF